MSSLSDAIVNDLLLLWFNGTPIANLADNAASSPLTNLCISLHTGDPGAGGNQATNEVSYTPYVRVNVVRTSGGWTVSNRSVVPVADILFAKPSGAAGQLVKFAAFGFAASGAGKIILRGPVDPITITVNNAPRLLRGSIFSID